MNNTLCITWFHHRRTSELCEYFGIPLIELISVHHGLRRYIELSIKTWDVLKSKRPRILIVQNPSLVLAIFTLLLRAYFGYHLVIDAHNEAVEPFAHSSFVMQWLTYLLLRQADRIIVTNQQLAVFVKEQGGVPLILPDRIPRPPLLLPPFNVSDKFNVAVIATFAADEPLDRIFSAAGALVSEAHFYVTGNYKKLNPGIIKTIPSNVTFCGFLPESEYWALLKNCDIAVDLTLKDNCLVCGAYEAIAIGTPILLSGNTASRELFADAAIFTDNTMESIRSSLQKATLVIQDLRSRTMGAKHRLEQSWITKAERVRGDIEQLVNSE